MAHRQSLLPTRVSSSFLMLSFVHVDRVVELEAIVEDLESQLVEQGREAEAAIAGWQEDYMRLEAEHDALVSSAKSLPKQLEGSVTPSLETTDDVSHETERAKIELISLRERLSEKEEELRVAQASLAQVNDAVETWKGRSVIRTRC